MKKVYHFNIGSLISTKLIFVALIFLTFGLALLQQGSLNDIYIVSEQYGGLWIILILAIAAFGETFIKLAGHRLEINDGIFSFKTVFGANWSIPIASIQRIDPKIRSQKNKGNFFTFTTDNKGYECAFVPKNYQELLTDLQIFNPKILIEEKAPTQFNVLGVDANLPINEYFEKKLGKQNIFTRFLIRMGSLSGVVLFLIFLVLAFFGIIVIAVLTQ